MQICHWYEPADEPGARVMVPGCMTRVDDPDQCTCEVTADAVIRLRAELETAEQAKRAVASSLADLTTAVMEHADGRQILARAKILRRATGRRT